MEIKVKYDGAYPNLCSGDLVVYVGRKKYEFPPHCLSSGGSISFDHEQDEAVCYKDDWHICEWPEDMPEGIRPAVEEAINSAIPQGCCGGCF